MASGFAKPLAAVSVRMRRVVSKDTGLERTMEGILKRLGIKYVSQPKVEGHPDFMITGTNILIFCDSSFWHGRNKKDLSGETFNKNKKLWMEKLNRNRKRDAVINRRLRQNGWRVYRFWDDEIYKKPDMVGEKISGASNGQNG